MIKKTIQNFDIEKIGRSGQCFRLNRLENNRHSLIAHGTYLEIGQQGEEVTFSCGEEEFERLWRHYFDLDTDYGSMEQAVDPDDEYLWRALECGRGIRILNQELWEVIISFIISQQNNIPRIKKCVESLCRNFGEKKENFRGETYYTFPEPQALSDITLEDLGVCSLGYRGKYIWKTAKMAAEKEVDLSAIRSMEYADAKQELMKLCGVGIKVAECICLFALHHIDAFPIDTHIQDMLDGYYPLGFPFKRYEGFAGVMQQYAFFYELYGKEPENERSGFQSEGRSKETAKKRGRKAECF